jgi:5-methylcytosine-specific restriction endonuclease McrBC regulatory subunit McrC
MRTYLTLPAIEFNLTLHSKFCLSLECIIVTYEEWAWSNACVRINRKSWNKLEKDNYNLNRKLVCKNIHDIDGIEYDKLIINYTI